MRALASGKVSKRRWTNPAILLGIVVAGVLVANSLLVGDEDHRPEPIPGPALVAPTPSIAPSADSLNGAQARHRASSPRSRMRVADAVDLHPILSSSVTWKEGTVWADDIGFISLGEDPATGPFVFRADGYSDLSVNTLPSDVYEPAGAVIRMTRQRAEVQVVDESGQAVFGYELYGWNSLLDSPRILKMGSREDLAAGMMVYATAERNRASEVVLLTGGPCEMALHEMYSRDLKFVCQSDPSAGGDRIQGESCLTGIAIRLQTRYGLSKWLKVSGDVKLPRVLVQVAEKDGTISIDHDRTRKSCADWSKTELGTGEWAASSGAAECTVICSVVDLPTIRVVDAQSRESIVGAIARVQVWLNDLNRWVANPGGPLGGHAQSNAEGVLQWTNGRAVEDWAGYQVRLVVSASGYDDAHFVDPGVTLAGRQSIIQMARASSRSVRICRASGEPMRHTAFTMRGVDDYVSWEATTDDAGAIRVAAPLGYRFEIIALGTRVVATLSESTEVIFPARGEVLLERPRGVREAVVLMSEAGEVFCRMRESDKGVYFGGLPLDVGLLVLGRDAAAQWCQARVRIDGDIRLHAEGPLVIPWNAKWNDQPDARGIFTASGCSPADVFVIPLFIRPGDTLPAGMISGPRFVIGRDMAFGLRGLHAEPTGLVAVLKRPPLDGDWVVGYSPSVTAINCSVYQLEMRPSNQWRGATAYFEGFGALQRSAALCGSGGFVLDRAAIVVPNVPADSRRVVWRRVGRKPLVFEVPTGFGSWVASDVDGIATITKSESEPK